MARIPLVTSTQDARTGRTSGRFDGRISAESMGAPQARALGQVAGALDDAGTGLFAYQERKRQEDVANKVAQSDFTPNELRLRNEAAANGEGYRDKALEEFDGWVDAQADAIDDDKTRKEFRDRMAPQRNSLSSRAAQWEFGTAAQYSQDQANESLSTLGNRVRSTPDQYDDLVGQGVAVIQANGSLTASARSSMSRAWREQAASSRFDGQMERAHSVQDVEAIRNELTSTEGRDWSKELSITDFSNKLKTLDSLQSSIQTKSDADARAAIDTIEARAQDVASGVPPEEMAAVGQLVQQSSNPVTAARYARLMRDNDIKQQYRNQPPAQIRQGLDASRGTGPKLPVRVNDAITKASQQTGIPASYLAGTVSREYGQFLTGPEEQIDYTRGNSAGASSATGIGQFLNGTALEVFRSQAFQSVYGSTAVLSDEQVKALRHDPEASIIGVAIMAKRSNAAVRSATGRDATDAEMYMGHFLGEGGLRALLIGLKADPNASAVNLFPQAAKANPTVYKNKDGSAKSLQDLYNELGRTFSKDATGIAYGDKQMGEKVLRDVETRLADDPMTLAMSVGVTTSTDIFSAGGMQQRGQEYMSMTDYYSLPASESKPFTKDEAASFKAQLDSSTSDEAVELIASVQQMGSVAAKAAMAQIGEDGNVFAYAGGLGLETGDMGTATDVIRGQKRITDNPAIWNDAGATKDDMTVAFNAATGSALYGIAPAQRQSILDAAKAHYIETNTARGKGWDDKQFTASIQAVMGGTKGAPAVAEVNGQPTIMPPGVSGDMMEAAFDTMNTADWAAMSVHGEPPRYADGTVADPATLADEAVLRAIGGGQYQVAMDDGQYLTTGKTTSNGQAELFLLQPTADAVSALNSRNEARAGIDAGQSGIAEYDGSMPPPPDRNFSGSPDDRSPQGAAQALANETSTIPEGTTDAQLSAMQAQMDTERPAQPLAMQGPDQPPPVMQGPDIPHGRIAPLDAVGSTDAMQEAMQEAMYQERRDPYAQQGPMPATGRAATMQAARNLARRSQQLNRGDAPTGKPGSEDLGWWIDPNTLTDNGLTEADMDALRRKYGR